MKQFEQGIQLAMSSFAALDSRGTKWKSRNVPIYIRQHLWVPYYLTEGSGELSLFMIQPPNEDHEKVHFARWLPDT